MKKLFLSALFLSAPVFAAPAKSGGNSPVKFPVRSKPIVSPSKPVVVTPKVSGATPQPSGKTATPGVSTAKPSGSTNKPSVPTPKLSVSTAKRNVSTAKPSVSTVKPIVSTAKQSGSTAKPVVVVAATLEKLPNGVQFIARPDKLAPLAAISIIIRAGAADENPQNAGWRRFLVGAMLRGVPQVPGSDGPTLTATPPGEGLLRAAERLGGNIGATVGDDFIEIYVTGDSKRAPELLDLALSLWQRPRLSDDDLKAARESSQNQIDADNLDTASKTQAALRSQLFRDARGELSAYGLPDYGTNESLAALTDERLRSFHASRVVGSAITVAAAGDFDAPALRERLAALPPSKALQPAIPTFAAPKSVAALVVRELPIPSAWVFISYPLAGDTQADAPALRVLASALGDSGVARLPARLLKNQPLGAQPVATSVAAQFIPRRFAGELVVFAQTGPQNVERVKNALLDEIRKLRDTPLTQSELESAKTYARGSWSLERQNARERAFQTALSPALGGPLDTTLPARLQAVTRAQVQNAAKKYLKNYAVALVMPGE